MKVTVTEQHLDKAIKAMEAGKKDYTDCLVATALRQVTRKKVYVFSNASPAKWSVRGKATINSQYFELDSTGRSLIGKFDREQFRQLRRVLPKTIELTPA